MEKKSFSLLLLYLAIWVLPAFPSWAGQVVTKEIKLWAKEALEQENNLKTITAPNTVAVLYFHNKTGMPDLDLLQKGLTIMLMTDLYKVKDIQLVERVNIQALVERLSPGGTGLVKPEISTRMGRLLGVEHLVGGVILKDKINGFQLSSSLLKVSAKEVFGRPEGRGRLPDELLRMEKDLLFGIIKELKIELSPEKEVELKRYLTENIKALLYLFEGIVHSDREEYLEAIRFYEKALEEDPNLTLAEDFIREIRIVVLKKAPGEPEAYSEVKTELVFDLEEGNRLDAEDDPRDRHTEDSDGDGIPDSSDGCPNDPEKTDPGQCGCGVLDTDSDSDGVADCNDGCPDDLEKTDPGICGCGVSEGCYSQADKPMIIDELSAIKAYDNIAGDDNLRGRVLNGEFKPGSLSYEGSSHGDGYEGWGYRWSGPYVFGLQIMGLDDEDGSPRCFLDQDALDWINDDPFLAYVIQVEEDRVNMEALEMCRQAAKGDLLSDVTWALEYGDIRYRDDLLMQQADAQSGRILKDRQGNWVRTQQYILRPDEQTVQMLNVTMRGEGHHANLSTIDFSTRVTGSLPGDLRDLPWNLWLNTITLSDNRFVLSPCWEPALDYMYVRFTNDGNESLKEQRWFDQRPIYSLLQHINCEQVTMTSEAGLEYTYNHTIIDPGNEEYVIESVDASGDNPDGFRYVFGDGKDAINVTFFVVGDGDTPGNRGEIHEYGEESFVDIWDALRVNEGYFCGPDIGNNNLEIVIDDERNFFAHPIDVVYTPMSRMLWK